jgi:polar amino acid transport system substrate-binding protein
VTEASAQGVAPVTRSLEIMTQPPDHIAAPAVVSALAPGGILHAAINLGNPVLASREPASGVPIGVSVDLAREFARRIGVPVEFVIFDKAAASVEAVRNERADIGFFAIDPARSDGLRFSAPYVLIEGSYLVRASSDITANSGVDVAGRRVSVGSGSAYDLFLTRELAHAEIVRFPGAQAALDALRAGDVDVAAGIRQVLEAAARRGPDLRGLPGRFMVIEQAMGLSASRGDDAHDVLSAFVEEMKASGFVADALSRHRIEGAIVAPLAPDYEVAIFDDEAVGLEAQQ